MMAALVAGERNRKVLARLARRTLRKKITGTTAPNAPSSLSAVPSSSSRGICFSDPESRFTDLGPGFYATRIDPDVLTGSIVTSASKPPLTWRYA